MLSLAVNNPRLAPGIKMMRPGHRYRRKSLSHGNPGNPRVRPQRIMTLGMSLINVFVIMNIHNLINTTCPAYNRMSIGKDPRLAPIRIPDTVYRGDPIPLNDIIAHVHRTLYAMNRNIQMPRAVDIVFGQCHWPFAQLR